MRARHALGAIGAVLVLAPLVACTASNAATATPSATPTVGNLTITVANRPFTLHVPASYNAAKPAPLVILLHGYTATGATQEGYMKFTPQSDKRGFLYAYPDGRVDSRNNHFWNATDACCDLYGANVDDSAYLSGVITQIEKSYNVDTKRVYLIGHSNGAFMSFRMACDHADQIAAIAVLNGAMWNDTSKCKPSGAVSILDVRSTADQTIMYGGGNILMHVYPSAATTNADWLRFDKCSPKATKAPSLDLVGDLAGAETTVARYATGCTAGSIVETWTINKGGHIPNFGPAFAPSVIDFLLSQSKPSV